MEGREEADFKGSDESGGFAEEGGGEGADNGE